MKKSNGQISTALSNASGDIQKAAQVLNVSVRWLLREKASRGL